MLPIEPWVERIVRREILDEQVDRFVFSPVRAVVRDHALDDWLELCYGLGLERPL